MDMTDHEAIELQWIENEDRMDLTDYERGRWLKEMLQRYPEIYPNQKALGERIGKDQSQVSRLIEHHEFIEKQKQSLSPDIMLRGIRLPERVTREIQQAPEELRPKVTKAVVEQGLSARETARVVDAITVPEVSTEVALKALQEDTRTRIEAEKKRQEALVKRLKQCYPAELVDEVTKGVGVASEGRMFKVLMDIVSAMWQKMKQVLQSDLEACIEEAVKRAKDLC